MGSGRRNRRRKCTASRIVAPSIPAPGVVNLSGPGIVTNPQLGAAVAINSLPQANILGVQAPGPLGIQVNVTPLSQMDQTFAKRVTGGEELSDEHKKQIQEQQRMNAMYDYMTAKKKAMKAQARLFRGWDKH